MKIVVSAGIYNEIVYPHDGFVNCFETFGNMFAKVGHDAIYFGLGNLIDDMGYVQDADLWITEFNTNYIPLYLLILNSKRKGKVWFVQHGSYDEFNRYDAWALKAINMGDAYLANTFHSKQFISNILEIPVYSDIAQPIDDTMFTAMEHVPKKNRIMLGHVGGREYPKEDPRRYHLLAASVFKDFPITIISLNGQYNRKFDFCDNVEFTEPKKDGGNPEYREFLASHKYYVSLSPIPTLGRDMIIAACSKTVSISSPYYYQQKLFPNTTAYQINELFQFRNLLNSDTSNITKFAYEAAKEYSYNKTYKRVEAKLGW